jgi:hypothetical protein
MIEDTTIPAKLCKCEKCGHEWTQTDGKLPQHCRNQDCKSREWNGKKKQLQSHIHEIKLPAPRKGGRPNTVTLLDDGE